VKDLPGRKELLKTIEKIRLAPSGENIAVDFSGL
jgi:hypothetical protein